MTNPFFKNKGPFRIDLLLKFAEIKNVHNLKNLTIYWLIYIDYFSWLNYKLSGRN